MIEVKTKEVERGLGTPPGANAPPSFIEKGSNLSNAITQSVTSLLTIMEEIIQEERDDQGKNGGREIGESLRSEKRKHEDAFQDGQEEKMIKPSEAIKNPGQEESHD